MKFPTYLESIVWLELKIKQLLINIFPVSEVITSKHSVLGPTKTKNIPLQQKSGGKKIKCTKTKIEAREYST